VSRVTRPVKELKGFQRITLAPGEKRTVTFEVGPEELAYHGLDMKRVVEPSRFQLMVGGSSAKVKSVTLDVAGQ
jgi:beta-glucosidase